MTLNKESESVAMLSMEHTEEISPTNNQDEENIVEIEEDWGDEFNNVVTILCGLHLNEYVEMFVSQGINLDIFLNLNEDDLCHIGMTSSEDRAKLLRGIKQLTRSRAKISSEVSLTKLSPDEVSSILANTVKHLTVIHASLAHTRLTLRNPAVHNSQMNLRLTSAEMLEILAAEANIQTQLVTNHLNALLAKKPGADNKAKSKWKFHLTLASSVGVLCIMVFCYKKII